MTDRNSQFLFKRNFKEIEQSSQVLCQRFSTERRDLTASLLTLIKIREKSVTPIRQPKILLLGYPMQEKSKLAQLLAEKFDLNLISMRYILEERRNKLKAYGNESHEILKQKLQVPDEFASSLIQHEIKSAASQLKGWLMEGFPRNRKQLAVYEKFRELPAFVKKIKFRY